MVKASHLTRRFGERVAVEDLSLELRPGEIFGLLGPNGGGKTTTLRMLAGLIAPSAGTIVLDDQPMSAGTAARLRERVGFLTETPGLWDQFSVRENLLVYARLHGLRRPAQAADEAMEQFGIRDRAADAAATLSKGLRQRVALARAMLHQPRIILLDEPTSGLDPESARAVRELIVRARSDRRTVILSTHNLDEVERLADRVGVLRQRLLALDTPSALRQRLFGSRLRIVLGQAAGSFAAALGLAGVIAEDSTLLVDLAATGTTTPDLVRRLVAAGADVLMVAAEEPPLEDVYLRLIEDGPAS